MPVANTTTTTVTSLTEEEQRENLEALLETILKHESTLTEEDLKPLGPSESTL